eukprot:Rmarinus@m.19502
MGFLGPGGSNVSPSAPPLPIPSAVALPIPSAPPGGCDFPTALQDVPSAPPLSLIEASAPDIPVPSDENPVVLPVACADGPVAAVTQNVAEVSTIHEALKVGEQDGFWSGLGKSTGVLIMTKALFGTDYMSYAAKHRTYRVVMVPPEFASHPDQIKRTDYLNLPYYELREECSIWQLFFYRASRSFLLRLFDGEKPVLTLSRNTCFQNSHFSTWGTPWEMVVTRPDGSVFCTLKENVDDIDKVANARWLLLPTSGQYAVATQLEDSDDESFKSCSSNLTNSSGSTEKPAHCSVAASTSCSQTSAVSGQHLDIGQIEAKIAQKYGTVFEPRYPQSNADTGPLDPLPAERESPGEGSIGPVDMSGHRREASETVPDTGAPSLVDLDLHGSEARGSSCAQPPTNPSNTDSAAGGLRAPDNVAACIVPNVSDHADGVRVTSTEHVDSFHGSPSHSTEAIEADAVKNTLGIVGLGLQRTEVSCTGSELLGESRTTATKPTKNRPGSELAESLMTDTRISEERPGRGVTDRTCSRIIAGTPGSGLTDSKCTLNIEDRLEGGLADSTRTLNIEGRLEGGLADSTRTLTIASTPGICRIKDALKDCSDTSECSDSADESDTLLAPRAIPRNLNSKPSYAGAGSTGVLRVLSSGGSTLPDGSAGTATDLPKAVGEETGGASIPPSNEAAAADDAAEGEHRKETASSETVLQRYKRYQRCRREERNKEAAEKRPLPKPLLGVQETSYGYLVEEHPKSGVEPLTRARIYVRTARDERASVFGKDIRILYQTKCVQTKAAVLLLAMFLYTTSHETGGVLDRGWG